MTTARKRRKKTLDRAPTFDRRGKAVPRDRFPDGRVRFSLGTTDAKEAEARRVELGKLWVWRAWDVLQGLASGALDAGNVAAAVKAEGEAALAGLRTEAMAKAAGGIPTVREMAEAYIAHYGRGRREAHSLRQIRSRILGKRKGKGFCQQRIPLDPEGKDEPVEVGTLPFPTLTPLLVERALHAGWSHSTTRESIRTAVSGLFSWAVDEERSRAKKAGHVPRWDENPAAGVESYETRPRVVTASEKQVLALLSHALPHQRGYLRAFLHLGLREDELVHTRLHLDLDPETWLWRIQERGPDERHRCIQCRAEGWSPKTARSHRTLLVPPAPTELRGALLDYLEAYPGEEGDFLFRNPATGKAWDVAALRKDFKRLCRRAEVTYGRDVPGGIVLHDLRATCATRLVQAKERESVIAALLGDTVQTIVNTYVRLTEHDTADAVSRGPTYRLSHEGR